MCKGHMKHSHEQTSPSLQTPVLTADWQDGQEAEVGEYRDLTDGTDQSTGSYRAVLTTLAEAPLSTVGPD